VKLFGEKQSQGRGQGGEPDVHMHEGTQGRGERSKGFGQGTAGQLVEPCRCGRGDRRAVPGLYAGPDHVRDTLQHGTARLAVLEDRRPAHRLGVRGVFDARHDPDGRPSARATRLGGRRRRRVLRQGTALGRQAGRQRPNGTPALAL